MCYLVTCILFLNSGVELLQQFREEYKKFEKERQELANAEKLFGIAITSYTVLMNMEQELKGLEQIFSIYERQKVYCCYIWWILRIPASEMTYILC